MRKTLPSDKTPCTNLPPLPFSLLTLPFSPLPLSPCQEGVPGSLLCPPGMDPEAFAELPEDIQAELLREYQGTTKENTQTYT